MDAKGKERVIDRMIETMLSSLKEERFDYCDLEILKIEENIMEFKMMMGAVLETASSDAKTVILYFFNKMVEKNIC